MPNANPTILILCENEHTAQLDRRALRDCGYQNARVMTSGIEAARTLASQSGEDEKIALVVCHERLADMRSDQFFAIIRTHPLLKNFPVLLILNNIPEAGRDLKHDMASLVISRPYSVSDLNKSITSLLATDKDKYNKQVENLDCEAFNKALASYGLLLCDERSTDDYFHMGMDYLKEQNWNLAISAFRKSVQDHRLKAEAELGMAAAYKGNNDVLNFRNSLANAAESFVRAEHWSRGRSAYARLLQHDKSAKNPFLTQAHRFIKSGNYKKAAEIIQESLPLIPKGHAGSKLAQLCFLADNPNAMFSSLQEMLNDENYAILKAEISHHLNILDREKEERERQKSAERKWELSRKARNRAEDRKPLVNLSTLKPELREENTVSFLDPDQDYIDDSFEDYIDTADQAERDNSENQEGTPVLAPLTRPEATSELFVKKPKFNEFLSVVKLTWKLARRAKKK